MSGHGVAIWAFVLLFLAPLNPAQDQSAQYQETYEKLVKTLSEKKSATCDVYVNLRITNKRYPTRDPEEQNIRYRLTIEEGKWKLVRISDSEQETVVGEGTHEEWTLSWKNQTDRKGAFDPKRKAGLELLLPPPPSLVQIGVFQESSFEGQEKRWMISGAWKGNQFPGLDQGFQLWVSEKGPESLNGSFTSPMDPDIRGWYSMRWEWDPSKRTR